MYGSLVHVLADGRGTWVILHWRVHICIESAQRVAVGNRAKGFVWSPLTDIVYACEKGQFWFVAGSLFGLAVHRLSVELRAKVKLEQRAEVSQLHWRVHSLFGLGSWSCEQRSVQLQRRVHWRQSATNGK